jgi:endonuclease G
MDRTPLESLLADKAVMAELASLEVVPPTTLRLRAVPSAESLRETARRLERPGGLEAAGGSDAVRGGAGIEAIVLAFGRPTLLVQDGVFATPELEVWRLRLEPVRGILERRLPSVGRIEIKRLPEDMHLGTGWLVAEDVVVTNRHVAEFFARGSGRTAVLAQDPFGQPVPVQIDFREEYARPDIAEHTVAEILWVETFDRRLPDLALLKLRRNGALPPPIELSTALPAIGEAAIAVIGYPAWDYRNDAATMRRLFGDIYGVKRLAPGFVSGAGEGFVFEHDCTTLGGNSGSVVLDAGTGKAVGLHFAGEFGVRNLAVRADKIAARLSELDVRVAVPATYLRLGDRAEAPELEAPRRAEDYADRLGYARDFVPGLDSVEPGFGRLADDLAPLADDSGSELKYTHFSIWISRSRRLALCTAVNIDGAALRRYARSEDRWYLDPRLDAESQVGNELYRRNRLDRGHLVRRLDPVWGDEGLARQAMDDTFHYTNAAPQHEGLNQVTWNELEDYILDNADAHDLKLSVFTGPVFRRGDPRYRDVELPEEFWKIIVMARREPDGRVLPHATAYLLSQADLLSHIEFAFGAFRTWQVPIALIEQRTGLDFAGLRPYDPLDAGGIEAPPHRAQLIQSWRDIVIARKSSAGSPRAEAYTLDRLRRALRAEQRRCSLDYIAEFAATPPADLADRVASVVPAIAGLEPVFANDPRFVRIRFPGADTVKLDTSPFELIEPLKAATGAVSVEPDLPTDFFPERRKPDEAGREAAELLGCWVGETVTPPADLVWALKNLRIPEAWAYSDAQNRPSRGLDVLIAQPDTGITDHPELLGAIEESHWADILDGGAPIDPLAPNDPLDNPGHGTGTGSVVASREVLSITGSAPAAKLVPIRCIESVVRITQSRVARAIEHAVDSGCHVVTMSLGGLWSRSLAVAVERAIEHNLIVLAAAGNCVRLVVWPARFERCLAVAGSTIDDGIWPGSCRGAAVDVSAPAQHVYRASRKPNDPNPSAFSPGEGTSFSVALVAGVAALWIAHHGRQNLIDSLAPGEKLQDRFTSLLRQTARIPAGWNTDEFGAGIVDARALLETGIGEAASFEAAGRRVGTPLSGDQADAARDVLTELAGGAEARFDPTLLERHGLELIWLVFMRERYGRALEGAALPRLSTALLRELDKPEQAGLARVLGLR